MNRDSLLAEVSRRLGNRQLVWFGTRGEDIESIADLPQLTAAFSVISTYRRRSTIEGLALEDITGIRVDLDAHDIDEEPDPAAVEEIRSSMLRILSQPSCVFTYRPSTLVSSVCFARRQTTKYLGMFKDHQFAFEHKPWVESAIADLGIPTIPWTYVADDNQRDSLSFLNTGSVMLRKSRSSGGTGLFRVENPEDLIHAWPRGQEAFVSVAPYVASGIPVNIGATVWQDGVSVDLPSVQLIGLEQCTDRPFGYCGNDFGAVRDLSGDVIDSLERNTVKIGHWMRERGYLGTFGVDFLVADGKALFTEVNPRFQGSTHLSARLELERGASCLLLEHLGANLGMECPREEPLRERVDATPDAAHMVLHRKSDMPEKIDPAPLVSTVSDTPGFLAADVLTRPDLVTDPGATIARITARERVTNDGFTLSDSWAESIAQWRASVMAS